MAKRRINKSQKVRAYLRRQPDAKPKEVSKALRRYRVSPAFVSNIKSKLKTESSNGLVSSLDNQPQLGIASDSHQVVAAAQLIKLCGGTERAKSALRAAAQVANALN